jgi:GntR family transcriptional regulator, hexuronate regulon transcriptional repressor
MTKVEASTPIAEKGGERLYQDLAQALLKEIASGKYPIGARLPAERELASLYNVSRPTVREAIIALEVQGLVEVKIGSGAYVRRLPGKDDLPGFNITAFELTEARLLFESEAAALAQLVEDIARENQDPAGTDQADRAFHLAIAKATRNTAIFEAIEHLWDLRKSSPEAALLHAKARTANVKPVVEEHTAILDGLRAHDPASARSAMRNHLSQVIDSLLFATEERQIEEARKSAQAKRDRYSKATA